MTGYIKLTGIVDVSHDILGSSWIIIPSATYTFNEFIITLHMRSCPHELFLLQYFSLQS